MNCGMMQRPALSAVICLERHNYRELPREYKVEFSGQKIHTKLRVFTPPTA